MKRILRIILISILLLNTNNLKITYAEESNQSYITPYSIYEKEQNEEKNQKNINLDYIKTTFITLIGLGAITLIIGALNNTQTKNNLKEKEVNLSKLDKNIDAIELKENIFKLYKDVQSAITKKRLKLLEPLVTEQLYTKYEKEINKLKENKQKKVITDILNKELKILSIEEKNSKKYIHAHLHVTQYDYTIDNNKKVISGTGEEKYQVEYKLTIEYLKNELKLHNIECVGKWITK